MPTKRPPSETQLLKFSKAHCRWLAEEIFAEWVQRKEAAVGKLDDFQYKDGRIFAEGWADTGSSNSCYIAMHGTDFAKNNRWTRAETIEIEVHWASEIWCVHVYFPVKMTLGMARDFAREIAKQELRLSAES